MDLNQNQQDQISAHSEVSTDVPLASVLQDDAYSELLMNHWQIHQPFHTNWGDCNLPPPRAGENQTTKHLLAAEAQSKQWDQSVPSPLPGSRDAQ